MSDDSVNGARRPRRHPDAAYKMVDGEALIVMPGNDAAHHVLNGVGAVIWDMMDGDHDVDQICARLTRDFAVEVEAARRDAREFLDALQQQGLLGADDKDEKMKRENS